jgi:hypothetical protein
MKKQILKWNYLIIKYFSIVIITFTTENAIENTEWFKKLTSIMEWIFNNLTIIVIVLIFLYLVFDTIKKVYRFNKWEKELLNKFNKYKNSHSGLSLANNEMVIHRNLPKYFNSKEIKYLIEKELVAIDKYIVL